MTAPAAEFLALQEAVAGEFSLQRELGRGGMGVVYLARDVQLDRDVAIKTLPAALARSAEARERFVREARTAAGLSHPHIVPIHRVGEAGGVVYFVMTFVDGVTLGERLRTSGPLGASDATRVLREVAWALAYAHGRGIVHRDIKPDNILLERETGRALVTDFGIARSDAHTGDERVSQPLMGTAHFMSPEQAANDTVDGRSDIYALGVVGHLAVSGRLPFEGSTFPALLVKQATQSPVSVLQVAPGLPSSLALTIDRCLARDPAMRYQNGESLAAALAPSLEPRQVLPTSMRAWLGARNPLLVPYLGWSTVFGLMTTGNLVAWVTGNRPDGPADIVLLAAIASLPLLPVVGFHLNQAKRQFRAGHTLADLRAAIGIARREQDDAEALSNADEESGTRKLLRGATVASAMTLAMTTAAMLFSANYGEPIRAIFVIVPLLTTMLLGAVSNALDVSFIPKRVRAWWQTGVRDRLWNSSAGDWLAGKLGAPAHSRAPVGAGGFRATEAALGAALGELFAALPDAFRVDLAELPATVEALEAHAAAARAELDVVAALAPSGTADSELLAVRRATAAGQLAASVAALENIRLDLLRLHAGAGDVAPMTTLLDAARVLSQDAVRLAAAQQEVHDALGSAPVRSP